MQKILKFLMVGVLACLMFTTAAEAKRIRIPVVIPGFGSSETIELVKKLPDIPELRRHDGIYVDLGYLHQRSGGKWVGYIGPGDKYANLTPEGLKYLMKVSGMTILPPEPKLAASKSSGTLTWTLVFLGLCYMVFKAFRLLTNVLRRGASAVGGISQSLSASNNSASSQFASTLDERMAAAAAAYNAGSATAQAAPSAYAPQNNYSFGQAPRTFGKR